MVRPAYAGDKRALVLAFDIGTTFSGVSYTLLDPGQVPHINSVTRYVSPLTLVTKGNSTESRFLDFLARLWPVLKLLLLSCTMPVEKLAPLGQRPPSWKLSTQQMRRGGLSSIGKPATELS